MYYRYEAKHEARTGAEWVGIFQTFYPSECRKWYCLTVPKWYEEHPHAKSKAWFTEHGYEKWKTKMEDMISNFHYGAKNGWEFRLVTADFLDDIVMSGKTQVIERVNVKHSCIEKTKQTRCLVIR